MGAEDALRQNVLKHFPESSAFLESPVTLANATAKVPVRPVALPALGALREPGCQLESRTREAATLTRLHVAARTPRPPRDPEPVSGRNHTHVSCSTQVAFSEIIGRPWPSYTVFLIFPRL